ncbi:GIY-YIG nuclease family protein [Roseomonas sp. HJA6]|uniref:GIY-YIG nuclease family protein n=1 Tax=Roseomonas alba TaxID=2846776 RepID=A0ABS7ADQ5_9PROT|nr:GIY-YIG nuclease family protein [Neoroseomonas alba]
MAINIKWARPLLVARNRNLAEIDYDEIENAPGVYFFSRKHGTAYIPFYVGRTRNMRARLKQHLAVANIQNVLCQVKRRDVPYIGHGARYFHQGYFVSGPGQVTNNCLAIVEKHLIRTALEEDCPLLNKHFTTVRTHEIEFSGPRIGHGVFRRQSKVLRN